MKKSLVISSVICMATLLLTAQLEGRGGGGGGSRGGGGGDRGGRGGSVDRSPSMSRSVSRTPTRTPAVSNNLSRPDRSQVNDRIRQTPRNVQDLTNRSNRLDNRQIGNVINDRVKNEQSRRDLGSKVRNDIGQQYPDRRDWFNNDFNVHHNYNPEYHWGNGNAWKWATWAGIAGWVNWGWNQPDYYDYTNDNGYVYADQVQEIASAGSSQDNQNADWMPLGVFSITKDSGYIATPNTYMQLALDRQGNIDGVFYNSTTDKTYPLEGFVDKDTQRAAWMVANNGNSPIVETGIYNLTKDETPVRIIYEDGSTQTALLVRLKQPES